jgi:phosphoglycolate phosphatase
MLRRTIGRAGGRLDSAVMVGDSATDIDTARAASIPVIGVDFGYSETPVAALKPDRLVSRFADVPAAVFDLIGNRTGEFARES